ncbi:hypothetical protein [Nocardia salmonicida]|uniref:hypothetical protein n=1 Tax=Nocardia salmonicida TaxID=53431 RepID=UPI0037A05B6D
MKRLMIVGVLAAMSSTVGAGIASAQSPAEARVVSGSLRTGSAAIGSTSFDTIDANLSLILRCTLLPSLSGAPRCTG